MVYLLLGRIIYAPLFLYIFINILPIILEYTLLLVYIPLLHLHFHIKYPNPSPLQLWNICKQKRFGNYLYRFIIGLYSPYSYSIKPIIESFNPNECVCSITDTIFNRNPFHSIHAIALNNLGELTSGLIMLEWLHKNHKKGIVTNIQCTYHKKARGKITAICKLDSTRVLQKTNIVKINMFDTNQTRVCSMECTWVIKI